MYKYYISKKWSLLAMTLLLQFIPLLATSKRFDPRLLSETELAELIKESQQEDQSPSPNISPDDLLEVRAINPKKPLTFLVFMAADNDLHYFAWKNIKQMELIGSNENVNIVVQLNTPGHLSPTKRYIVKKGRRILVQDPDSPTQKLNSGNPYTLIDFVEWAASHYPADEYALILWNHGSGAMDPSFAKTINPCELFYCNPSNNMLELDRGTSYINLMVQLAAKAHNEQKRGICFDETFKSYISNQDFEFAMHEICTKVLRGNKLGIVAFDACLMSMIEISTICKKYAKFMVGSQEVEYGTGWNYELVLRPFTQKVLSSQQLAEHIVHSYEQAYHKIINDYTQSALNLAMCDALEDNVNKVSQLIIEALSDTNHHHTINILKKCKSTQYCTCFDEPSYIDLGHFYKNLLQHTNYIKLQDQSREAQLQESLKHLLNQGLSILSSVVIANKTGSKLKKAHGISIYFPEHAMSQSYLRSSFALNNHWGTLLAKYILG